MIDDDTSDFFRQGVATRDVPRDGHGRYVLPGSDGEPKSWTRATTFAATLAEQHGLSTWHQYQVVRGFIAQPSLLELAHTIDPADNKALGKIVAEAHLAAGTKNKADLGTARHAAIASVERTGSWDQVPPDAVADVSGYFREIARIGVQIVPQYVERTGICPAYDVAGTPDNFVYCLWDGMFRVLDKKTGRLDMSEVEFAIQLALYSRLVALRNYATNTYEPMPTNLATDYAIIAHVLVGQGITTTRRVDIELGWLWCRTAAEARTARKTRSVITPWITPDVQPSFAVRTDASFPSFADHDLALPMPNFGPIAPVATEPGCLHPACTLEHPHAGPAVLAPTPDADDTSGFFNQPDVPEAAFTPGASVAEPGTAVPAEPAVDPETEAAELAKLTKAELSALALDVMMIAGVTPDGPGSIKTKQHKPKVAAEIVAFKNARGIVACPPRGKSIKGKAAVAEVKAAEQKSFLNVDAEMRVIKACLSVRALMTLRGEWTNAGRWTDAHEQAALTRRAELEQPITDAVSDEQALTPIQQLQGATSIQTIERVWQRVTNGGTDLAPWTAELQAAASAKTAELNGAPA